MPRPAVTGEPRRENLRRVLAVKIVRTFSYGFLGILFPVHLARLGMGADGIGIAITLTLLASAGLTWAIRHPAERWGTRRALLGVSVLFLGGGVFFLVGRTPFIAVVGAVLTSLAVGMTESGPFMSLEQIVVARAVPEGAQLNRAFSVYHFAGYGAAALGSLMVGSPEALGQWMGRSLPYTLVFWLLLACALAQLVLYARLSEIDDAAPPRPASAPRPSGALIRRLAALFALDAFGGGFAMQSLISYWFYVRFGVDLVSLGFIFLGTQLLSAVSLLVAANVANRIGLINTMVFSHLISNGLLIAMAFAPSVTIAVGLLLTRHLLSQMDVPTRQAYLMSVVEDHEREAAASVTNTTRTIAQAVSPAMTGYVMQAVSVSAPFVLSGVLKSIYDLLIYFMFRNIKPRGERSV